METRYDATLEEVWRIKREIASEYPSLEAYFKGMMGQPAWGFKPEGLQSQLLHLGRKLFEHFLDDAAGSVVMVGYEFYHGFCFLVF